MNMLCAEGHGRALLEVDPAGLGGDDVKALAGAFIGGITREPAPQRIVTLSQARGWQRAGDAIVACSRAGDNVDREGVVDARWAVRCVTLKLLYSGWLAEACTLACHAQGVSQTLSSPEAGSAIIFQWLAEQRQGVAQGEDSTSWESTWYSWAAVTGEEARTMLI